MVFDLFGLTDDEVRRRFPEAYQHLLETVKVARQRVFERSPTRDAKEYLDRWWLFGKPREELRPAIEGLPRYIATVETAKHRVFQFIDQKIIPDNMLVVVASNDAFILGILSSRTHLHWALAAGGWLGVGNDPRWSKSRTFDPFPFPECREPIRTAIAQIGEELDAHRKARQELHPQLTLTQLYNVLEKLRAADPLTEAEEQIKTDGLVLILKELHDKLDALVLRAYGWTDQPSDETILERLVKLNAERALAEAAGDVKWLRPDYQIPRLGSQAERARLEEQRRQPLAGAGIDRQIVLDLDDDLREMLPRFPTGDQLAETASIMRVLGTADSPLSIEAISIRFAQGRRIEKRVGLTILALARHGHLATSDRGETFTLRRG